MDESLPDIRQAKHLATLYHMRLDDLIAFDLEVTEIEEAIAKVSEETQKKVDWTKVWSQKYPILATYPNEVKIEDYRLRSKPCCKSSKRTMVIRTKMLFSFLKIFSLKFGRILKHVWSCDKQTHARVFFT